MKAMFLAFACVAGLAIVAHFALDQMGFSSADRTSSSSVRLD